MTKNTPNSPNQKLKNQLNAHKSHSKSHNKWQSKIKIETMKIKTQRLIKISHNFQFNWIETTTFSSQSNNIKTMSTPKSTFLARKIQSDRDN